MPVEGYVGLPRSGKTIKAVELAMQAVADGRELWTNFGLGARFDGFQIKCCTFAGNTKPYPHTCAWELQPVTPELVDLAGRYGWRRGRGFVQSPRVNMIHCWDQLMQLRVARDVFGKPHRQDCDMESCEGCSGGLTVVLDELNLWAPSRLWAKLSIGVLTRWAYVGKDGMNVIWTAQHESRIDKVAREVTDFIWTVEKIGPLQVPFAGWIPVVGKARLTLFHRQKWVPTLMSDSNRSMTTEGFRQSGIKDNEWSRLKGWVMDSYDTYEHVVASAHLINEDGSCAVHRGPGAIPRASVGGRGPRTRPRPELVAVAAGG